MIVGPKSRLKPLVPAVVGNQSDSSKEAMGSRKRKSEEAQQDMQPTDEKSSGDEEYKEKMIAVPKLRFKSLTWKQSDFSKEAMGSRKRKSEEALQYMQPTDEKSRGDEEYEEKMIAVPESQIKFLVPAVVWNQSDSAKEAMGFRKRKSEEALQDMQPTDEKSSGSDGSSSSQPQQRVITDKLYGDTINAPRVPRFFDPCFRKNDDGEEDGFYKFSFRDMEFLDMCSRSSIFQGLQRLTGFSWPIEPSERKVYHVKVNANSCRGRECVELLKKIGCKEKQFIACSAEDPTLFFAELNEDEAAKLKDEAGILCARQRPVMCTPF